MTMAQGDYLPGTYSRVGTEENPGTYLGGDFRAVLSQTMPPKVKKVWVLEHDRWNMRNYWISGGKFQYFRQYGYLPKRSFGTTSAKWMKDGFWRMGQLIFLYRQYLA